MGRVAGVARLPDDGYWLDASKPESVTRRTLWHTPWQKCTICVRRHASPLRLWRKGHKRQREREREQGAPLVSVTHLCICEGQHHPNSVGELQAPGSASSARQPCTTCACKLRDSSFRRNYRGGHRSPDVPVQARAPSRMDFGKLWPSTLDKWHQAVGRPKARLGKVASVIRSRPSMREYKGKVACPQHPAQTRLAAEVSVRGQRFSAVLLSLLSLCCSTMWLFQSPRLGHIWQCW